MVVELWDAHTSFGTTLYATLSVCQELCRGDDAMQLWVQAVWNRGTDFFFATAPTVKQNVKQKWQAYPQFVALDVWRHTQLVPSHH